MPTFKIAKPVLAFLTLCAVAACMPTGEDFHSPGIAAAQKAADVDYCNDYAIGHWGSAPHGGVSQRRALFNTCMMDRGYTKAR